MIQTIQTKRSIYVLFLSLIIFFSGLSAHAEKTLELSCSDQIHQAFVQPSIDSFSKKHGVQVNVYNTNSRCALERLVNGFSSLSAITHTLDYQMKEYGYIEIPFGKDPIAIIVNSDLSLENITDTQFKYIFNRKITNWRELGGPDVKIILVIPGKNTELYKNFYHIAMNRSPIQYDYISYKSTATAEVVKRFKGAISFIARGAVIKEKGITVLNVNGKSTTDPEYPYHQIFSFVTKGKPVGLPKLYIQFAFSDEGLLLMEEKGINLIPALEDPNLLK